MPTQLMDKLEEVKKQVKSILALKQQTATITRLKSEITRTQNEISDLELELSATGSTKTLDEVQGELNDITSEL